VIEEHAVAELHRAHVVPGLKVPNAVPVLDALPLEDVDAEHVGLGLHQPVGHDSFS
jgi:hypothetical protein